MKMPRRHSSVTTTPTKEEEASTNNIKITTALLTDDIAIDYTKLSPSRSYTALDNEDNNIATGGGGGGSKYELFSEVNNTSIVTPILTRSHSTPTNNTFTSSTNRTTNIHAIATITPLDTPLDTSFDSNTATPKRNPKITEAFNKINNMASQIKNSQIQTEKKQVEENEALWNAVKKIDNSTTTAGNNMESNKVDTTAETTPLSNENNSNNGEGAPSLEWTVDWNLCNTSNNFSANPCGGTAANCTPSTFCGANECWNAFPDNDVFACNDFFDLNAATTKADINNVVTPNNNVNKKNGQVVQIAEEYNEVIEINDKVAADISAGKDDVDGSMSQSLAVVEWLKDEYMASIGATEVETDTTTPEQQEKGTKEGPSSPTSVIDCAQSTLSSSVAEVTTAISSIPTSMCKQETIVSSTIVCCGVFDSIVQIPQSFNDVVTCQLFPDTSSDVDDDDKGEVPKSDIDDKVGNEKIVKGNEKVAKSEVGKVDDYKMVSSEELGLKLPKEDSDSSGCDSVGGLCENIDQVFISEDDEDVMIDDDDNSQPSI